METDDLGLIPSVDWNFLSKNSLQNLYFSFLQHPSWKSGFSSLLSFLSNSHYLLFSSSQLASLTQNSFFCLLLLLISYACWTKFRNGLSVSILSLGGSKVDPDTTRKVGYLGHSQCKEKNRQKNPDNAIFRQTQSKRKVRTKKTSMWKSNFKLSWIWNQFQAGITVDWFGNA